jgi:hypothetical protein
LHPVERETTDFTAESLKRGFPHGGRIRHRSKDDAVKQSRRDNGHWRCCCCYCCRRRDFGDFMRAEAMELIPTFARSLVSSALYAPHRPQLSLCELFFSD